VTAGSDLSARTRTLTSMSKLTCRLPQVALVLTCAVIVESIQIWAPYQLDHAR
jgi:hypothetical protein